MVILVTAYENPDLDGTACTFAYAEFLNKTGKEAIAGLFGEPHREAKFVLKTFCIPALKNASDIYDSIKDVVLVDASDLGGLSTELNPNDIIEIIDHRLINEVHNFPNAKVQIELVGSAATLVAEKFVKFKVDISKEAAALLYSAIISNTINFNAGVTTERDRKMSEWLKTKFILPKNYTHLMFKDKSVFRESLKDTIVGDFATFSFNGKIVGIAQLEILSVGNFMEQNKGEIKNILIELKNEKKLDFIFISCIDLEEAFNLFVTIDEPSANIIQKSINIKLNNLTGRRKGILMRKQIVPLIKEYLENN